MTEEGTIVRKRSFVQVPDDLVTDERLTANAVRVWARLDKYAGAQGQAFPSRETLARDLGLSARHVARALAELVDAGWISREQRDGTTSLYRLHERTTRATGVTGPTGEPVTPAARGRDARGTGGVTPVAHKGDPPKETHQGITAPAADAVDPAGTEELELGLPAAPTVRNPVQVLVGAYADAVKGRGGTASRSLLGAVGKSVKRLVDEGVPEPVLLDVVVQAAAKGRRDLDTILAAPNGPLSAFERRQDARDRMFARWHDVAARLDGRSS